MERSELEVLPAAMAAGAARTFARRHVLKFKHPAIETPDDLLTSLSAAFGAPPKEDPQGYVLWHRQTGTHFTARLDDSWPAYGGGLTFAELPDLETLRAAYVAESARRAAIEIVGGSDPMLAGLVGNASSFNDHARELERAQKLAPPGFFAFLGQFELLMEQYPPPDRRRVVSHGLDASVPTAVSLVAKGVEKGKYFEKPATVEEAYDAVSTKLASRAEQIPQVLFDWWAQHAKQGKPPEPIATLLRKAWRAGLAEALHEAPPPDEAKGYQEAARSRHDDHERAQRWMRFARLGFLLPLTLDDVQNLAEGAKGVAMQSVEYKKLEKVRRTLSEPE